MDDNSTTLRFALDQLKHASIASAVALDGLDNESPTPAEVFKEIDTALWSLNVARGSLVQVYGAEAAADTGFGSIRLGVDHVIGRAA